MTFKRFACTLTLALAVSPFAGLTVAAEATEEDSFSEANRLLFLKDHLTDTDYPARYTYEVVTSGPVDENVENRITMTAHNITGSDAKHVEIDMLQEDHGAIDDIDNARGNPLIMVFLQSDVVDLAAETGGHWRYFQKQMKLALENSAEVEPVTVEFQGESVAGQRITIRPYSGEQTHRQELGRYVDKTYEFTLSDRVPGNIVELRATVPPADGSGTPLVTKLKLRSVENIGDRG